MIDSKEIAIFKVLRNEVAQVFVQKHPAISMNMQEWKGQDIVFFQEDLQEKLNTTVSEKWFYTYFKQEELSKLPRIDMLNLLSQYVGVESWQAFVQNNSEIQVANKVKPSNKKSLIYASGFVLFALLAFFIYPKSIHYNFCFVDKDVSIPITTPLQIQIIKEGESPIYLNTSENGCFEYSTSDKSILFIVQSPYYKSDTIVRTYNANVSTEDVKLAADEYALILHYFSSNNVEDWNNRRTELAKMIHNDAIIYQVFGSESFGIDILSKEAFINKITLPTSSLRNMKIIEIERKNNQIVKLKFETKLDYE